MNSDEMQNAIEFLLKNQANFEVQLEKTNRQIEQTQRQVEQTEKQLERTNQQLAQTDQQLERTDQQVMLTSQRVSLLAETQTEFIQAMTGHVGAQAEINADLRRTMRQLAQAQSDLTKTVDGLVKTVYKNGNPLQ
jgi:chromosome segregation ATPase